MSEDSGEKKIIVDEDWKAQVEAEKQRLQEAADEPAATDDANAGPAGEMPPATFGVLLTTLATEAMVCLGQIPHPATGKAIINLPTAKYFIDTLGVLEEKTKGNLDAAEAQALEDLLHQLRLVFVAAKSGAGPAVEPPEGESPIQF